jgi:hypothetical protein
MCALRRMEVRMKRYALIATFLVALSFGAATAQDDPCAGLDLAQGEVGLAYEGHCIGVQENGPTVQPIIVRVTEGLGGVESVMGILVIRTVDGWVVAEPEFYETRGVDGAAIGDEDFDVTGKR